MTYVQSIYPSIYNTNVIYIVHSHSSNHPNSKEENIIFTSYPTFNFVVFESSHILLKQTNPSSYIFTIELYYACKRHIIKHVNDNGFNIPQHQGQYESFKFIGMHLSQSNVKMLHFAMFKRGFDDCILQLKVMKMCLNFYFILV